MKNEILKNALENTHMQNQFKLAITPNYGKVVMKIILLELGEIGAALDKYTIQFQQSLNILNSDEFYDS